jgi:hypothetical protein
VTKKKGQPVKVGLDSLGTRMVAGFPKMVPGAGLEPARLAAGDFESPLVLIWLYLVMLIYTIQINTLREKAGYLTSQFVD